MAYNAGTNWANEEKYLNGLISQGGGNAAWARQQMNELNAARQQYGGGQSQTQGGTSSPGSASTPSGGANSVYDWANDRTDYSQRMLDAKDIQEFLAAAQARENKANAQGTDIRSGTNGIRSNEQLYNEWMQRTGYNPGEGDFVYRGWGWDSVNEKEGIINNAGLGHGYYGMDGEGHWGYYEDPELTRKMQNGTWDDYASSDGGYVRMDTSRGQPDMTVRDTSRAGQTVILTTPQGTWECTYGENGYMTRMVRTSNTYTPGLLPARADNDAGVSSEELLRGQTGSNYTGPGSTVDQSRVTPSTREDYLAAMAARGESSGGTGAGMGGTLPDAAGGGSSTGGTLSGIGSGSTGGGSSTGGSGTSGSGYDLSEWLKKQYEGMLESELAGLKDAYEKNTAELDDAEARLGGIYDPQRNRIAAQNALEKRTWDERAAANGLSSGASGQAELARASTMARDLASIGEEEANARADVSLRKKNLTIEYTNAIAQARANGQAELAQALYNELIRVQGLEREDQIRESEQALQRAQQQMEYELALRQMQSDAASQGTSTPSLTASQAYTAWKNGIRTDEVMAAMQYYYGIGGSSSGGTGSTGSTGTSSGSTGTSGSSGGTSGSASGGTSSAGGYNESYFNAAMRSLSSMLASGKTDAAVNGIDSFWDKLNSAQKAQVVALLKKYGLSYTED